MLGELASKQANQDLVVAAAAATVVQETKNCTEERESSSSGIVVKLKTFPKGFRSSRVTQGIEKKSRERTYQCERPTTTTTKLEEDFPC